MSCTRQHSAKVNRKELRRSKVTCTTAYKPKARKLNKEEGRTMRKEAGGYMTFGDRLAYARKKRGLLQSQLAESIGIDRTTLSNWETGRSFPKPSIRVSVIQKMVESLEISEDWLMGNDDNSNLDNLTENTKSIRLTKEQLQLVIDNEPVIGAVFKKFARQHYLDRDTYSDLYGDAAIALCRAAKDYKKTLNKKNAPFFNFAYSYVLMAMVNSHCKNNLYYHCNDTSDLCGTGNHKELVTINEVIRTSVGGDDMELESLIVDPEDEFEKLEYRILVESVFQKVEPVLSDKENETLRLFLQGKKSKQIGKILHIPLHTANSRIHLAKVKCRAAFNPDEMFA